MYQKWGKKPQQIFNDVESIIASFYLSAMCWFLERTFYQKQECLSALCRVTFNVGISV